MASRATGARFRQRKLSTKHALSVVREDEILDSVGDDNDPQRNVPRVETGVEKAEETVRAIQPTSLHALADRFIGTPSPGCHLGLCSGVARWQSRSDIHSNSRNQIQQCALRSTIP